MTIDEVKALLKANGFSIGDEKRLANDSGSQLKLVSGQIVNVFDKGGYNVQGRELGPITLLLEQATTATGSSSGHPSTDLHPFQRPR